MEDVSFRDVKIKIPEKEWCHAPEAHAEDFEKVVELRTRHRTRRVDFQGTLRPDEFARYGDRTRWGGRWKSQNRKNVYLSPYVEEPLNSKLIKGFVPELRSRYVFFVFRDPYVLCIYVMNILCTFHISIFGYSTNPLLKNETQQLFPVPQRWKRYF